MLSSNGLCCQHNGIISSLRRFQAIPFQPSVPSQRKYTKVNKLLFGLNATVVPDLKDVKDIIMQLLAAKIFVPTFKYKEKGDVDVICAALGVNSNMN
jgi:hypothetical protein